MQADEVVVTKFDLSSKEQTLKSRFLTSQRTTVQTQPQKAQPTPSDPQLDAFLRDMQESLRQQPVGALAGELLKKQANMMQQQIDLLRENQSTSQALMQNLARQTATDPKRAVAELMVPIMAQLKEMHSLHRDTKQSAEMLGLQLQQLKLDVESRGKAPEQVKDTVQGSMDKFALHKALLQQKASEARKLIDEAVSQDGGVAAATEGIKYLQSQVKQYQAETESIERELMARFQRIVEQAQRVKSLPHEVLYPTSDYESARERIQKRLGGVFLYEKLVEDLDQMKGERSQLALEFKRTAPNYPKYPRPTLVVVANGAEGKQKGRQKTMKPAPVPMVQTKKTLTKKPQNITDIISDPQNPPPAVTKSKTPRSKQKTPRSEAEKLPKPAMVSQETQSEALKVTPRPASPMEESGEKTIEPIANPQPFQLTEEQVATKKRIQPSDLLPSTYNSPIPLSKPVETVSPPLVNWERQTVDIVTEYVLAQKLIGDGGVRRKPREWPGAMGRWLGPEQLEALIREGIFIDAGTVEKLGLEVLDEAVSRAKMEASVRKEEGKSAEIESEEQYGSDFEAEHEEIPEESDHSAERVEEIPANAHLSPQEKPFDPSISFSKISPRREFPSPEAKPVGESRAANDISALFDPAMLSKMSPAAVQQYVNSLIESGHIGPRTENASVSASQSVPVAREEQKEPFKEELERMLGTDLTAELIGTLRDQHQALTQEMIARLAKSLSPGEPEKAELPSEPSSGKAAPGSDFPSTGQFQAAFALPKRLNLDLDLEEAKLQAEQSLPRMTLKLPPFRPPEIPAETASNTSLYLSDSSVGGRSIGTDIFSLGDTEYMGSLAQYMQALGSMEEGQVAGNPELSDGEVPIGDEALSSGEIPPDIFSPNPALDFPRPKVNVTDLLGPDDGLEGSSEGEFDPHVLFRP